MGFLTDIFEALTRQTARPDYKPAASMPPPILTAPPNPEIQTMIDHTLATLAARPVPPPPEPKPSEALPSAANTEFRAFRDATERKSERTDGDTSGFRPFTGGDRPFRAFRCARECSNNIEDDPYDIGIEPPGGYPAWQLPYIEEARARQRQRFEDAMLGPLRARLYAWKPSDYVTAAERRGSLEALAREFGLDDPEDELSFALENLYREHLRERSRVEELQVVRSRQRDRGRSR